MIVHNKEKNVALTKLRDWSKRVRDPITRNFYFKFKTDDDASLFTIVYNTVLNNYEERDTAVKEEIRGCDDHGTVKKMSSTKKEDTCDEVITIAMGNFQLGHKDEEKEDEDDLPESDSVEDDLAAETQPPFDPFFPSFSDE